MKNPFAKMATTLSRTIKKAAASSLILRTTRKTSHRNYTTAMYNSPLKISSTIDTTNLSRQVFGTIHNRLSSLAEKTSNIDDTLLSLIECELDCLEKKFRKVAATDFPFKIVDDPDTIITLTREYQGEEIKVEVLYPIDESEYHWIMEDEEKAKKRDVYFNVSVSNKRGQILWFYVRTNAADGIIKINDFHVNDDKPCSVAPEFSDFDENSQKAFHKYLEVRGFEPTNTKFICEYIFLQRKHMKRTTLLRNLKKFIVE